MPTPKGKYGQMMAYISANAQPGDALVLNNPLQKPLYRYYAPRDLPAYFLPDGDAPLEDPQMRAQLENIARQHSRVWLVMFGNPAEYDPTGYLERWLGANAFKTFARGFVDAALSLYVMPSAQPAIHRDLRATLGENIRLDRLFDLDRAEIAPGQALLLTLRWQATAPISTPLQSLRARHRRAQPRDAIAGVGADGQRTGRRLAFDDDVARRRDD